MSGDCMREKSEQEQFWKGTFGDEYNTRNIIEPAERADFFRNVFKLTGGIESICELGANRGHNLLAIQSINENLELTGVEINGKAFNELSEISGIRSINSSIQDYSENVSFDLVFTCGVLIHINPSDLPLVYKKIYELSKKYILVNEYYNPTPIEIAYRGYTGKLFKRDFAGEILDMYDNLKIESYGFLWGRVEPAWDNSTWFLLSK